MQPRKTQRSCLIVAPKGRLNVLKITIVLVIASIFCGCATYDKSYIWAYNKFINEDAKGEQGDVSE
jgi:hypothetical protein